MPAPHPNVAVRTIKAARGFALRMAARHMLPSEVMFLRGPATRRRVALTFDDGPDALTPRYLEILETAGARATRKLRRSKIVVQDVAVCATAHRAARRIDCRMALEKTALVNYMAVATMDETKHALCRAAFGKDPPSRAAHQVPAAVMNAMTARIKLLGRMDVIERRVEGC